MKALICSALVGWIGSAAVAEDVVTSAGDLLELLPGGIQWKVGAPSVRPAVVLANQLLARKAFDREASMSLRFKTVEHQAQGLDGHATAAQAEPPSPGDAADRARSRPARSLDP